MNSLPALAEPYALSPEVIEHYQTNGHVRLEALATPAEIAAYREVIVEAALRHNRETRPIEERDTYGKAFLQIMNLWVVDENVRRFVFAKRFAQVSAELMGVKGVRLYHDQALFKEPGGGPTPWHQDQFYWPLAETNTVTLWMPLVDIDATMGSMTFANRSHEAGFIPIPDQISDASERFFADYVTEKGYALAGGGPMNAGDATFHSGYCLHKAPGNPTDRMRSVMTIIYMDAEITVREPGNDFQKADLEVWLNHAAVGSVPSGPLNPVLWP